MIRPAPRRRAPAVAHSPIGPCANTATMSPILMSARSAPAKPVDMMSGHISTCSSLSPSGIGAVGLRVGHQHVFRLCAIDGVAEAPATHRLVAVTMALPILRGHAIPAGIEWKLGRSRRPARAGLPVALTSRPSFSITPTGSWPMVRPCATGYSPLRICTSVPQMVVVVTRSRASPAHFRDRLFLQGDLAGTEKDGGSHVCHGAPWRRCREDHSRQRVPA